jgi:hypothetical protein
MMARKNVAGKSPGEPRGPAPGGPRTPDEAAAKTALARRRTAAAKHRPKRIRLLLVAESPPQELDRYFYFEDAPELDPLFEAVYEVLFEEKPDLRQTTAHLKQLRRRGLFSIELKPDLGGSGAKQPEYVPWLVVRCEDLQPEHIVIVGAPVFRAAYPALAKAGLPVVDVKVDFPSAGRQSDFRRQFRSALVKAGLENLIRPPARR